jgi:hypothetical protein
MHEAGLPPNAEHMLSAHAMSHLCVDVGVMDGVREVVGVTEGDCVELSGADALSDFEDVKETLLVLVGVAAAVVEMESVGDAEIDLVAVGVLENVGLAVGLTLLVLVSDTDFVGDGVPVIVRLVVRVSLGVRVGVRVWL